jgi:tRNA G18 (ribose-2'-O)-methylase SpoU
MSMTRLAGDEDQQSGVFYSCVDEDGCGLRFPVAASPFNGRCPRCGGEVRLVAHVKSSAEEESGGVPTSAFFASRINLLLDNWRSLFNVGSIFRSADGAGVRHLYLCGISGRPDSQRKLAKTALGAERAVEWSYHADAVRLALTLQQEGTQLWVLERSDAATSLFSITTLPDAPLVLAAGNEIAGVDPGLIEIADKVIQLPMMGSKRSLNVAVAMSIATYWLRAQELATVGAHYPFP